MKKYLFPLLVLLLMSIGLRWLEAVVVGAFGFYLITILRALLLFWFGLTLNFKRQRHETWLRKIIVSFVFIFFLVWDLGFSMIPQLKVIFNNLGLYGYMVYFIYIYCGWSFFD